MKALTMTCVALVATASVALAADGWKKYRANEYGFEMMVPAGTTFAEKDLGGGWGFLYATVDGVELYGVGRLGAPAERSEIEKFGVKATGVAGKHWTEIDSGKNHKGWTWYRTVKAEHKGKILFGGYGVGKKGSYCLVVKTTRADFEAHKADYEAWYESVRLF